MHMDRTINPPSLAAPPAWRRLPLTLYVGAFIIVMCEVLLFADVFLNHRGAFHSDIAIEVYDASHIPATFLTRAARFMAFNITAIAWVGYLLLLDGLLESGVALRWHGRLARGGYKKRNTGETPVPHRSPIRSRPHHFFLLCLASVVIWCIFDAVNFYSIRAWRYIGMPANFADRALGYFFAFGTIVPGMLLSGQALLNLGLFSWARAGRRSQRSEVRDQKSEVRDQKQGSHDLTSDLRPLTSESADPLRRSVAPTACCASFRRSVAI
jgi:hypothetical protein